MSVNGLKRDVSYERITVKENGKAGREDEANYIPFESQSNDIDNIHIERDQQACGAFVPG